jgi:hypothetical protein
MDVSRDRNVNTYGGETPRGGLVVIDVQRK